MAACYDRRQLVIPEGGWGRPGAAGAAGGGRGRPRALPLRGSATLGSCAAISLESRALFILQIRTSRITYTVAKQLFSVAHAF